MDQAQRSDAFNSHERDIHSRSAFSKRPQPPHQRLVAEGIFFLLLLQIVQKNGIFMFVWLKITIIHGVCSHATHIFMMYLLTPSLTHNFINLQRCKRNILWKFIQHIFVALISYYSCSSSTGCFLFPPHHNLIYNNS